MASQLGVSLEPKCFDSQPNAFSSQLTALEMLHLLSVFSVLCISQLVSDPACVSPSVSVFFLGHDLSGTLCLFISQ